MVHALGVLMDLQEQEAAMEWAAQDQKDLMLLVLDLRILDLKIVDLLEARTERLGRALIA